MTYQENERNLDLLICPKVVYSQYRHLVLGHQIVLCNKTGQVHIFSPTIPSKLELMTFTIARLHLELIIK